MLMMSRRLGEAVLIGDEIEIVIAHISRSRVKVGIRAPRSMPVIAHELRLVRNENLAAARVPQPSPATLSDLLARLHPAAGIDPEKSSGKNGY